MKVNWLIAGALVALMGATGLSKIPEQAQAPVAPRLLSETGLYAGEGTRVLDVRNRPFAPQYPLWSDGAGKRRWVRLPEGTTIDVTNADRWDFPVGTRFWKEFDFDGHKVETRFLWKVSKTNWVFASYAWNAEQTEAMRVPESGQPDAALIAPGKRHGIPSVMECRACHDSSRTEILGFNALQLSDDRDPNALHADPLTADMITLRTLVDESLISPRRTHFTTNPPRITAATPEARAALGYLSTNCGSCHNRESSIASLGLLLKHDLGGGNPSLSAEARSAKVEVPPVTECTPALATTVGRRGHWLVPANPDESRVINPGKPELSSLIERVRSRRPSSQMPPIGTVVRDRAAVELLTAWVTASPDEWARLAATCGPGRS
ncbi:MAG: c-type cytochrome domain-containing protein [Acidobacteriota bacterium]|nr:c-type cytochrome domain-containing protein [Acidobacteriota bacterium]